MRTTSKSSIKNIALILSGIGFLCVLFWIGSGILRPIDVSQPLPPKKPVTFNASLDIRTHPLFADLQSYFEWDPNPTRVGNAYPFVGSDIQGGAGISVGDLRPFAMLQTVDSGEGWNPKVLSRLLDGTAAILWVKRSPEKLQYEIRQYPSTSTHDVLSSWDAENASSEVSAFAQTSNGDIWILNSSGVVGKVQKGKDVRPNWMDNVQTGLAGGRIRMYIDSGDRVWITDGTNAAVGGDQGFQPVDVLSQLSAPDRTDLEQSIITSIPAPQSQDQKDQALRYALRPFDFFGLNSGKTGLTTQSGVLIFPLSAFARPAWINLASVGVKPLAIAKDGGIWGERLSDHALEYVNGTTTKTFASVTTAPRDARTNPNIFTFFDTRVYALDYVSTSTIVWHNDGAGWIPQWVTTSTLPEAQTVEAIMDRQGSMWSKMSDGRVLHIAP